ncbi:hypothetical protein HMPREF9123_0618 [Neisseria bacilliformis ATCC BAA-1200]|uniref:Uncharacterized protein n=1 Tax=Neisseria bacilliformis ATCC BAA-1200 TaxID=888742 RepID=F2BA64_9NEIS|nr:hypothetical protein HMPREF9123_0618 [Neisseria bacilliformis ATCC BAA-1200]
MLLTVVSLLFFRPYRLRGRLKAGFQTASVYTKKTACAGQAI